MKHNSRSRRILLISPNMLGIRDGINRIQPGLGIMYIAAVLETRGFEVAIYDAALEGYERQVDSRIHPSLVVIGASDEAIRARVADFKPDVVGISVLFYNQSSQARVVARLVKEVDPSIPVVIGGNQVSEEYPALMADAHIDFAMLEECDTAFADFVEAYFAQRDHLAVPGLVHRAGEGLKVNPPGKRIGDLNRLPFPARHLANMEKYFDISMFHNPYSREKRVGNVMTSRGCPEKCTFCTTPLRWGRKIRWRTPENVAREIRQLKEDFGVREVQFEDDTLTLNLPNLLKLCDLLAPLGLVWNTVNGIRADYHGSKGGAQEMMFRKMADSGCYQVCLGVETGSQHLLDHLLHKRLQLSQVMPCVEAARKAGISVHIFLMVGFPGETLEEMEKTIAYAAQLEADSYSISIYTPLPGTPLFRYSQENGYLVEGFTRDHILFAKSNIKIPGISGEDFEKLVSRWTNRLNHRLKERDPAKFQAKYNKFLDSDQTFLFRKHS